MAQRKTEERNVRKLCKVGRGRTVAVTLPIELVRALRWREGQKVVVKKRGQGLVIEDWKEK